MGKLATYIAIQGDRLDELWAMDDEPFRRAFLDVENDESLLRLEIGKIWDALHCTLTGKPAAEPIEGDRLSESVVGTYPKIYDDEDYSLFVSVIDNGEINDILQALAAVDADNLSARFDADSLKRNRVYPAGIWNDPADSLINEMANAIDTIKEFFEQIAKTDLHIIATII